MWKPYVRDRKKRPCSDRGSSGGRKQLGVFKSPVQTFIVNDYCYGAAQV